MNAQPQKITQVFEAGGGRLNQYTRIPKSVEEHFQINIGAVVTLAAAHPMMMSQNQAVGRVPVHYREIPEELLAELRSYGFGVHEVDGTVRKADCCLYRQSVEERDHWREQRFYEQRLREDPEAIMDAIETAARETRSRRSTSVVRGVDDSHWRPISDHVYFDKSLADKED